MTNNLKRRITFVLLIAGMIIQSCREHIIVPPANEEELITTVILSFQPVNEAGEFVGAPIQFSWRDRDASGNPEIDEVVLAKESRYLLSVEVLDESKTPAGDITEEIDAEAEEHQFFFVAEGVSVIINYNDGDRDNFPVGLVNLAETGSAGAGSLTVILRHEPDKSAAGVSEGNPENAGGDTDIETTFPLVVE